MALRFSGEGTEMKILKGVCSEKNGSAIIGRILPSDYAEGLYRGEAVIVVEEGDRPLERRDGTVGVIRLSPCPAETADPCARIVLPFLPNGCIGKIALLDTAAGTLFVSPDISTVNRYTAISKNDTSTVGHLCRFYSSEYGHINLFPYLKNTDDITEATGCILDAQPESFEEEYLFERYRDTAENAPWKAITLVSRSKKFRSEEIRAAMRSGVYGNISLLFGGVISEGEMTEALDALCHAFCELELEGREFNGYIPRGLLIDTPYMLWIAKRLRGMDFFVYDIPTLAERTVGETESIPAEPLRFLCEIIRDISTERNDCEHRIITDGTLLSQDCCKILLSGGITRLFALPHNISQLCETIEKILK